MRRRWLLLRLLDECVVDQARKEGLGTVKTREECVATCGHVQQATCSSIAGWMGVYSRQYAFLLLAGWGCTAGNMHFYCWLDGGVQQATCSSIFGWLGVCSRQRAVLFLAGWECAAVIVQF